RVRRLHRACRRRGGALVFLSGLGCRRQSHHDHRRSLAGSKGRSAEGLDCRTGATVWLLPVGHADGGGGVAQVHAEPDGRPDRRGDHQYLPLRDLSSSPAGDSSRRGRRVSMTLTAKAFRKIAVFAAVVVLTYALIVLDTRAAGPIAQASVASVEKGYVVQEIRDRLYWLSDGAYNTMFVVSSEGVIAIDPLPTLGGNYLKAIADVTDKPVTHVIYSHEHTDHIGAAYLFPKTATIIANRETAKLLATRNDPRRPLPTVTFE